MPMHSLCMHISYCFKGNRLYFSIINFVVDIYYFYLFFLIKNKLFIAFLVKNNIKLSDEAITQRNELLVNKYCEN